MDGHDTRGVLKHPENSSSDGFHSLDDHLNRSRSQRTFVRWDEVNLQENEEAKVPRMKIDEPKTPYHRPRAGSFGSGTSVEILDLIDPAESCQLSLDFQPMQVAVSDDGLSSPDSIRGQQRVLETPSNRIAMNLASAALTRRRDEWDSSDDEAPTANSTDQQGIETEKARREDDFKKKRRDHYNEYLVMKHRRLSGDDLADDPHE